MVYVVVKDNAAGKTYPTPHASKYEAARWMKKESELIMSNIREKYFGIVTRAMVGENNIIVYSEDRAYDYILSIVEA